MATRPCRWARSVSCRALVGGVAAVEGLDAGEPGLGQLGHGRGEPGRRQPEGEGVGEDGHRARAPGQVGHLGRGDPGLGDVGRPSLGQPAVEGVGDRLGRPVADQHGGHVGPADALLARGLGHQLVVGDRDPQLAQSPDQVAVALHPVVAQAGQLVLEGALAVLDEVDEDVGAVLPEGARDLAPGDQLDARALRPAGGRGRSRPGCRDR